MIVAWRIFNFLLISCWKNPHFLLGLSLWICKSNPGEPHQSLNFTWKCQILNMKSNCLAWKCNLINQNSKLGQHVNFSLKTRQCSTVRNSDRKIWAVNMNLWKMVTPVKHSPLYPPCLCPPSSCPPSQNIHHWKIFTPQKYLPLTYINPWKYSQLKNIHSWKKIMSKEYSPLKNIHPWKIFTPANIHTWKIHNPEK